MTTLSPHFPGVPAAKSVFISYARRNSPYAQRLRTDLERAGVDVWLDTSNIPPGERWKDEILKNLTERTHVILLVSPEAVGSKWVNKEVEEALSQGKTVIPLQLVGKSGSMPDEWEKLNMITAAVPNYGPTVRTLIEALDAPNRRVLSLMDMLDLGKGTVADVVKELSAGTTEIIAGRQFAKLPVAPSAYGQIWLYAPLDAPLERARNLGVLFQFTGDAPGERHKEAIRHWSEQMKEQQPWLLMIEGPISEDPKQPGVRKYLMRTEVPHECADLLAAAQRAMEQVVKGCHRVGFYLNCLNTFAFELGIRTTTMTQRRRIFHYPHHTSGLKYEILHDGWD